MQHTSPRSSGGPARRPAVSAVRHSPVTHTERAILSLLIVDTGAFSTAEEITDALAGEALGDGRSALGLDQRPTPTAQRLTVAEVRDALGRLLLFDRIRERWWEEVGAFGRTYRPGWIVTDAGRDCLAEAEP